MARVEIPPSTPETGSAWIEAAETGARTWMSAVTSLVRMSASVAETQAVIGEAMVSFWMRGFPAGPAATPDLLRENLVLAGLEAERAADAAHKTLQDLERPSDAAAIPIPLPE